MVERKELYIKIGERIRYSRKTAGITQERLAELTNVTVQYISALERGQAGTSVFTLINICMVLHVSSDYILMDRELPIVMSPEYRRLEYLDNEQKEIVNRGINVMMDAMALKKGHQSV